MRHISVKRFGGPEELRLLTSRKTPLPRPSEVLVRLEAAGVNPVDTYMRSGAQGYDPPLPFTPGMDGAGIVEQVGEAVDDITPGQRVYTAGTITGTYAEYCLCAPDQLFPLPEQLSFAQGASLGVPYFTAARALFTRGGAAEGMSVLIHGATGGVGTACLQLAAGRGITLLGTAGSPEGRRLVENSGARCFSHKDPNHFDAIRNHTGGLDLIIEMLADVNLHGDISLLNTGGRVVVVGSRGRIEIAPRDLMFAEGTVTAVRMPLSTPDERLNYAALIRAGVESGQVNPPIARRFPLEEAAAAHQAVIDGPHLGSIVLDIDSAA